MIESVIFTSFRFKSVAGEQARSFHTTNSISIKYDKFDSAIINRITMCTSKFQHWRYMCIGIFQYCMQFLFLVQFSWVLISTLTWLFICDFHKIETKKNRMFRSSIYLFRWNHVVYWIANLITQFSEKNLRSAWYNLVVFLLFKINQYWNFVRPI